MSYLRLGTHNDIDTVYRVAGLCGFDVSEWTPGYYASVMRRHTRVEDLYLQIHYPAFYKDTEFKTEIEFNDATGRLPDNPAAIAVLRKMNEELTDLVWRKAFLAEAPSPIQPLSEYFRGACTQ
jgi:hypothetical protein